MRQKIKELLDAVKKLEKESARAAKESKSAADEASGGLGASYSAAGDAEHARNSANLSIQKHRAIKKLKEELEDAVKENAPKTASPVSFVALEYAGGRKQDVYLVKNPVYISGFNLISIVSPLGRAIGELKAGDTFVYAINDEAHTGKILEIG